MVSVPGLGTRTALGKSHPGPFSTGSLPRAAADSLSLLAGLMTAAALIVGGPVRAAVTFDWATVGDPGNPADTLVMDKGPAADYTTGYGSVDYVYRISKYDVTNSQYVEFLNATDPFGTNTYQNYIPRMSANSLGIAYTGGIDLNPSATDGAKYAVKPGQANLPATWINWAMGARFVNWLSNGQGGGSTESGVYDMSVLTSGFAAPPPRADGATIFMPSENEYYKAAYYDPQKDGTGGYWQYGVQSDSPPASLPPPGTTVAANIGTGLGPGGTATSYATTQAEFDASVNYLTDVGAYATATSGYGLYDVEGLVYNWVDDATRSNSLGTYPIYRGGAWRYGEVYDGAAYRNVYSGAAVASYAWYGLRIASLPEPSTDIVIDVTSGTVTQAQAGYTEILVADSVTKTGAGTLIFGAANSYTGPTTVSAGTLQVANAAGLSATVVTVGTGATLAVASGTTMQSPSVIVDGGTLSATSLAVNSSTGITSLAINAGTIVGSPLVTIGTGGELALPQDARVTVAVGGLSVDQASGGGRLDLGGGQVSVAAGGILAADLRADIIAGRNGGAWNGTAGITSSTAAASGGTRGVGYVVASNGAATVSFAAPGDTNLNGSVDVFDLVSVNSSGKYGTGTAADWSQGDFNYDGVTNVFDLVGINSAGAYGQGNYFPATPSSVGGVAAVPEPALGWCGLILGAGGMALARSRSQRR